MSCVYVKYKLPYNQIDRLSNVIGSRNEQQIKF